VSNRVEMMVSGTNQPQTYAIVDVLRVVPVAETNIAGIGPQGSIDGYLTSNGFLLRFSGQRGVSYAIQRAAGLMTGWSTLQILSPVASGFLEYEDERPSSGQAFYRILAE